MKQFGFSMLEVLIAIVIFSVGLLGLSGLQLISLSSNQSASIRSNATTLAYDMVDRMKANMNGVIAGNYDNASGTDNACQAVHYNDTHTPNTCTPAQLAADDIFDWQETVKGTLTGGTATICIDSSPATEACDGSGTSYAVRVSWNDKPKNAEPVTKSVVVGFQP